MFQKVNVDTRILAISACIFLSFLIPHHVHPYRAFYQELIPISAIAMGIAFCANKKMGAWQLVTPTLLPILVAVTIAMQVSLGKFVSSADAILPISYLLIATLAISLGAKFASENRGFERLVNYLALACLLAAVLSSVIASFQLIGAEWRLGAFAVQMPHQANQDIRAYANVSQPNQLALLFCMGIAALWWVYQIGKIGTAAIAALALIVLWGLALTQSRIGWLIIPVFALCMLRWRTGTSFRKMPIGAIAGLVIAYAAIVALVPRIAVLLGASVASASERAQTGTERISLYQQAWAMSWQHPWTGVGWFQFGPNQLKLATDFQQSTYAEHSHNLVLNLIAELGWPIGVAIVAATVWWCIASYRCPKKTSEGAFSTLFFWAVGIHSMVEFPLWYAYVLVPSALLLGASHQAQFGSREITMPRWVDAAVVILITAGIATVATDYRRLVVGFKALQFERLGLRAVEGSTDKPAFTMFPQFYDYFKFIKTPAHAGMTPGEIAAMERTASRFGFAPTLMRMTLVYALNGRENDAVKTMETIRRLHPANYAETYSAWSKMSVDQPAVYAAAFRKFRSPTSDQPEPEKIGN